jgi:type II secretory ATPase GspE/PulE/Tfp pilus assembly ATPase PilB-like protein
VVGSLAQRLVRKVCPRCPVAREPTATEAMAYEQEMQVAAPEFMVGQGCNFCNGTGYSGRTGVYEVIAVDESIRKLIASGASGPEIRAQALLNGMIPMRRAGMLKAKEGSTTLSKIFRGVFSID